MTRRSTVGRTIDPTPGYRADYDPEPLCEAAEYSVGEGMDYPDAPLSPLGKLNRGESGDRVG